MIFVCARVPRSLGAGSTATNPIFGVCGTQRGRVFWPSAPVARALFEVEPADRSSHEASDGESRDARRPNRSDRPATGRSI